MGILRQILCPDGFPVRRGGGQYGQRLQVVLAVSANEGEVGDQFVEEGFW